MCEITSVDLQNVMHGRIKGNVDELKAFQKRILKTLERLDVRNEGGSIKQIHSSEVVNEEHIIDLEIWILLDKKVEIDGEFDFLEHFTLNDVVMIEHKGSPEDSDKTIAKLENYLEKNHLFPTEPAYNHSLHLVRKNMEKEEMHFKVYLKVKKQ